MIVPGSVNPLLMAMFGDPLDELGKIDRSVRFRASATASFTRVFGAPTNAKKWTFSAWVKKSRLALYQGLFDSYYNGSNFTSVMFDNADKFWLGNVAGGSIASQALSNAIYRDPASHVHVQAVFDSDNATAADRCILYVGGVRIPITGSTPLGQSSYINQAGYTHSIGRRIDANYNFDGCMSFPAFIDGQALAPTAFGQFHPRTGQWRPKPKAAIRAAVAAGGGARNGWGANGCFLPFDDTTSTTTLGYDRSQSDTDTTGNNWTATNLSLTAGVTYDSMLDTPTNNFCTLNPLANTQTLSNGNLTVTAAGTSTATHGTQPIDPTQPIYYEIANTTQTSAAISIGVGVVSASVPPSANYAINVTPHIAGFYASNGQYIMRDNGTNFNVSGSVLLATDVIQIAVNGVNLWVGKNNVWWDSAGGTTGNPATGANPTVTLDANTTYVPYVHAGSNTAHINFGQRPFTYTPPWLKSELATKNRPLPPVPKSSSAFAAVTDSGANVIATLAAAAPWADFIKIYKRRDAAEGWRWQFSDDAANYLDSASNGAKAAFPALGGSSYVGYALKVSPLNGVATGRLVHVNGAADVIADGLGKSRKMILLKNEAVGTWYVYHPELTAGKLVYLETSSAETTDATISTVTSTGFTVAAALASGTYRWVALAETAGFLRLFKMTGHTDGPFANAAHDVAFVMLRRYDATPNASYTYARNRDPYNPAKQELYLGATTQELTNGSGGVDLTSCGTKLRFQDANINVSAALHFGLSIAAFPLRYANAQ